MNIEEVFDYIDLTCWKDETPNNFVFSAAKKFEKSLTAFTQKKVLHRLSGQSGTGKTTQLCAALTNVFENEKPLIIGVRSFAKYHPKLTQIRKKFGEALVREKTNGFALKCLCASLEIIAKHNIFLIIDLTLLDPIFEKYFNFVFNKYSYQINIHLIALNKKISNMFIEKRKNSLIGNEKGRVIFKSSSDYFYKILPKSLKYISKAYPDTSIVIWNVFSKEPVYEGKVFNCLKIFKQNRAFVTSLMFSEKELLESKKCFYKKLLIGQDYIFMKF